MVDYELGQPFFLVLIEKYELLSHLEPRIYSR